MSQSSEQAHSQGQPPVGTTQNANAPDFEAWEKDKLLKVLDKIDQLYSETRYLRTALPRIIEPLATEPHKSPQAVLQSFIQTVQSIQGDLTNYQEQMSSTTTKEILDYTEQSMKVDSSNIPIWTPFDETAWTQR